tara:strand:+ start:764 stop:937 length:174 start_codon:yes stop_codon:yes gene_type:complete
MNKKAPNEQKSTTITIRMRRQDRDKLEDMAKLNELSLGSVLRGLLKEANPKKAITKD